MNQAPEAASVWQSTAPVVSVFPLLTVECMACPALPQMLVGHFAAGVAGGGRYRGRHRGCRQAASVVVAKPKVRSSNCEGRPRLLAVAAIPTVKRRVTNAVRRRRDA